MFIEKKLIIVVDVSTFKIQIGLIKNNYWINFYYKENSLNIYQDINKGIKKCLKNYKIEDLDGFFYCKGPGYKKGVLLSYTLGNIIKSFSNNKNFLLYSFSNLDFIKYQILKDNNNISNKFYVLMYINDNLLFLKDFNQKKIIKIDKNLMYKLKYDKYLIFMNNKNIDKKIFSLPNFHIINYDIKNYCNFFYLQNLLNKKIIIE